MKTSRLCTLAIATVVSAFGGGCFESTEQSADGVTAQTTGAEDTYVTTSYATTPRGTRTELKVGATSSVTQQAYLKFQVGGIPQGATNITASLQLYAQTTSTDAIEAHVANSTSWSESTLVW